MLRLIENILKLDTTAMTARTTAVPCHGLGHRGRAGGELHLSLPARLALHRASTSTLCEGDKIIRAYSVGMRFVGHNGVGYGGALAVEPQVD